MLFEMNLLNNASYLLSNGPILSKCMHNKVMYNTIEGLTIRIK